MHLGEAYLQHYTRYLSDLDLRTHAKLDHDGATVQLLTYPDAVRGTQVLATLGLTHYQDLLGEVAEVVVPVHGAG